MLAAAERQWLYSNSACSYRDMDKHLNAHRGDN